jgi:hypothetical protein
MQGSAQPDSILHALHEAAEEAKKYKNEYQE